MGKFGVFRIVADQTDNRWAFPASEMSAFRDFKELYNSQLGAMLNGTSYSESQFSLNPDSPYGLSDASFIMRYDQMITEIQYTLKTSPAIRELAQNDPALAGFINNMNGNGVIDEHMISALSRLDALDTGDTLLNNKIGAANTLASSYAQLPQHLQAGIETSQLLYNRSDRDTQAETLVSLLEDELDVSQGMITGNIDPITAKALSQRLMEMKALHPQDDTENFDPLKFDQRTMDFLNRVKDRQMAENGVTGDNIEQFRLHMLTMRMLGDNEGQSGLGDTLFLADAMNYITSGDLPSGARGPRPAVQNNWGQNADPHNIAFFNNGVYSQALNNRIHIEDVLATNRINPWRNELRDSAIQRILQKDKNWQGSEFDDNQRTVETLASKLRNFENGGRNVTLTREELGLIAIEMMSIQAEQQGLTDNQIDDAIRNRQYMVSAPDLHLVHEGMGVSQEVLDLITQKAESGDLVARAIAKEIANSPANAAELAKTYLGRELGEYHSDKWSSRFAADGAHSPAPFQEYIRSNRYDDTEYNQGVQQYLRNRAMDNFTAAPDDRADLSSATTSDFANVTGSEDDDEIIVAAADITGNDPIEGELPLGTSDPEVGLVLAGQTASNAG